MKSTRVAITIMEKVLLLRMEIIQKKMLAYIYFEMRNANCKVKILLLNNNKAILKNNKILLTRITKAIKTLSPILIRIIKKQKILKRKIK